MEEEHGTSSRLLLFGDEHSNLLDQYERTLYLIDVDKAILSCTLSEPANSKYFPYEEFAFNAPALIVKPVDQGKKEHQVLRIHKALKKLARPAIFKHKKKARKCRKQGDGDKVRFECKPFSRSSLGY